MCGLAGFFRRGGFSTDDSEQVVRSMADTMLHRGPDDEGAWIDSGAGIALSHRRLAVLDLSPAGRQPMCSSSGRYVIAFNGEIYNHLNIRKKLMSARTEAAWRGHSDTETLLAAIECWGVESALDKSVGMFAFALWDRRERILTIARDRMGEKPLYYGWQHDCFLFASELKALRAYPGFEADIDRDILPRYFSHGYIPAPYSIYKNTFKLTPGTYLQLSEVDEPGTTPGPREYWSLRDVAERGLGSAFSGTDREALDELELHLTEAVKLQSVADVPVGAFLSGGIDSTTTTALMQAQASNPVKTFTIGFREGGFDEATHAREVARYLGTDHTELYLEPGEAMDVIPELPALYDEPFGDSSAIPTYLISRMARRHVTVSLSGDGGDELFGGYSRYTRSGDAWRTVRNVPRFARESLSKGMRLLIRSRPNASFAPKIDRLSHYMAAGSIEECYDIQIAQSLDRFVLGGSNGSASEPGASAYRLSNGGFYDTIMFMDGLNYLPEDILAKVDRASMAVSLECRVPMLNQSVVEFAWSLPMHMKIRNGVGKWILRQLLGKYVPQSLTDRPKMGFGVPVGEWIRGPMREWAESLVSEERLRRDGFLDVRQVRSKWLRHLGGASVGADSVWTILMFQAWLSSRADIL